MTARATGSPPAGPWCTDSTTRGMSSRRSVPGWSATRSRRTADRRRRGQSLAERRTGTAALLSAVLLVVVGTVVGVVGAAVLLGLAQHLGLELPEGSAGQGGLLVQLAGRISP